MMKALPDQSYLKERFDYDPLTGALTWKPLQEGQHHSARFIKIFNTTYAGNEAGNIKLQDNGYTYVQVYLDRKNYKAHRLIWKWVTGEDPAVIDHENQNGADNKWANLRNGSQADNCKNTRRRKSNTSGVTGVSWSNRLSKWVVQVQCGKVKFKARFSSFDDAVEAAKHVHNQLNFSRNHGAER